MSTVTIGNLANAGDVQELAAEEMKNITGGQKADIGGWDALFSIIDPLISPFDPIAGGRST